MKLHEVYPGLYVRGRFDKGGWSTERKVQELMKAGIDVVVNVSPRPDTELWQRMRDAYIFEPLSDGKHVPVDKVSRLSQGIAWQVRAEARGVLVHCNAGQNRSCLVAALALRELTGCSGYSAVERVRAARPNALANPAFVKYLEGLE